MAETNRAGVKDAETRILYEGREGGERVVRRGRKAKGSGATDASVEEAKS